MEEGEVLAKRNKLCGPGRGDKRRHWVNMVRRLDR